MIQFHWNAILEITIDWNFKDLFYLWECNLSKWWPLYFLEEGIFNSLYHWYARNYIHCFVNITLMSQGGRRDWLVKTRKVEDFDTKSKGKVTKISYFWLNLIYSDRGTVEDLQIPFYLWESQIAKLEDFWEEKLLPRSGVSNYFVLLFRITITRRAIIFLPVDVGSTKDWQASFICQRWCK